ncbi:MFS transporter [Streptomyces sp. NBC_01275]|uniref:MFS transporter n=1 Tax=Streptomyces sp. NBC_01275 TaxID=2903807 RepID=UPI002254C726|nr:MFS transporter [Streptomyces sp. NBC_01275]MCX4760228.1 MFS transporter [Streptomyces sp. NBC_01275]
MTSASSAEALVLSTARHRRRWAGLVVVASAQLVAMLDETVINIALPSAQRSLHMADADRQWIITAYTLAFGGLLLFGGRLSDRFGPKRTFMVGITGFAVMSAVGGAAGSGGMLIAARALQGVFAAVLSPSTLSMVTALFADKKERAKAFGVYSGIIASGAVLGLLIGGMLTEYLSWRWCLFINVPIAAMALAAAPFLLPVVPGDRTARPNVPDIALAGVGMAALVFGFSEVEGHGWGSGRVLGLLALSVVLLTGFVLRQARASQPLLPLRVLNDRNRAGAFLAVALSEFGLLGVSLFATYQLQVIMHYSPVKAGLAFLPMVVVTVVAATQIAARLLPHVSSRWLIAPGLLCIAGGIAMFNLMSTDSTYLGTILPIWTVLGLGLGLITPSATNTVMLGTLPHDRGITAAFRTTSQQVGGSVGLALANTLAASAVASYVVSHTATGTTEQFTAEALVHGTAVAASWSSALIAVGTIAVFWLIDSRPETGGEQSDTKKEQDHPATP